MIRFDGQTFSDAVELKRYCDDRLKEANDGDMQTRSKYDMDMDCDQDWMWGR